MSSDACFGYISGLYGHTYSRKCGFRTNLILFLLAVQSRVRTIRLIRLTLSLYYILCSADGDILKIMKTLKMVFPVSAVIKKGGSDNVRKLYFPDDDWIFSMSPDHVLIHIGKVSFSNPTEKEWITYHSFNNSKTISKWIFDNNIQLDTELRFVAIVDSYNILHLIWIQE